MASRSGHARTSAPWIREFVLRVLLVLPLAGTVWALGVHPYNRLLCRSTEAVLHLFEKPDASRLDYREHSAHVRRLDFAGDRGYLYRIRVTDLHFPAFLAWTLLVATPRVSWNRRLRALGFSLPILFLFHVLQLGVFVQAVYATQLGAWSESHYGVWSRNFWGLANHVLDLAIKFALPLVLWAAWFLRELPLRAARGVDSSGSDL